MYSVCVYVCVFNVPPTAKVIWRLQGSQFSLTRQSGEAGDQTCDAWLSGLSITPQVTPHPCLYSDAMRTCTRI